MTHEVYRECSDDFTTYCGDILDEITESDYSNLMISCLNANKNSLEKPCLQQVRNRSITVYHILFFIINIIANHLLLLLLLLILSFA